MDSSRLQQYTVYYHNSEEYHHLKREIFTGDLYYFETEEQNPYIIDAGAHIGLATLYFKQVYPTATIVAIEPNPPIFSVLEKNVFENQLESVTCIQAALAEKSGSAPLFFDDNPQLIKGWYSTASFLKGSWAETQTSDEIVVPTYPLSEFVTRPVDFLKIDIEGAEQAVLFAAADCLPLIREFHIEFHTHRTQSLKKLLDLLEKTHVLELFKGTTIVPLKKATGLVHIRGVLRKKFWK